MEYHRPRKVGERWGLIDRENKLTTVAYECGLEESFMAS